MPAAASLPGPVALFGSGETAAVGGTVFERLARHLSGSPRVAVMETPAGFQPNSAEVAGRVADFMRSRLRSYRPVVTVVPARRRDPPWSTDDPDLLRPLLDSNMLFLGAGSPTYAVRHLQDSLAWHTVVARHRLGAPVALASAGCIAAGDAALPVYEIFKAGADLHWTPGLRLFAPYGLSLVIVPHWNNTEGGAGLDTSRCFMGRERFAALCALLPDGCPVIGIDEHTVLLLDLVQSVAEVQGKGTVTIVRATTERQFAAGDRFALSVLGPFHLPEPGNGIPTPVWAAAQAAGSASGDNADVPDDVIALVNQREVARQRRDWQTADQMRQQLARMGWAVHDTHDGGRLDPIEEDPSG